MDETTAAEAESKREERPSQPLAENGEARYRRRKELLGSARGKLVLGLVILILLVGGIFAWRYLTSYESTDDAQIDGHVNSVSARVSGHVLRLNVEDNQYVEKGTVLVEIDPADYEVAVRRPAPNMPMRKRKRRLPTLTCQSPMSVLRARWQARRRVWPMPKLESRRRASNTKLPRRRLRRPKPTTSRRKTILFVTSN